jgi:hypothetical protein
VSGKLSRMHIVGASKGYVDEKSTSARSVMIADWAERVIDVERAQSRRRHPSNQEPAWEKDGGYVLTEWAV